MTKRSNDDLSVADASGLTDGDWAEINRLKRAYDEGGDKAFSEEAGTHPSGISTLGSEDRAVNARSGGNQKHEYEIQPQPAQRD